MNEDSLTMEASFRFGGQVHIPHEVLDSKIEQAIGRLSPVLPATRRTIRASQFVSDPSPGKDNTKGLLDLVEVANQMVLTDFMEVYSIFRNEGMDNTYAGNSASSHAALRVHFDSGTYLHNASLRWLPMISLAGDHCFNTRLLFGDGFGNPPTGPVEIWNYFPFYEDMACGNVFLGSVKWIKEGDPEIRFHSHYQFIENICIGAWGASVPVAYFGTRNNGRMTNCVLYGDHRRAKGHCAGVIMRPMFQTGPFLGDWHWATDPTGGWNTDMKLRRCHFENFSSAIVGTPGLNFDISHNQFPLCSNAMNITNCSRGQITNNIADLNAYWSGENQKNGKEGAGAFIVFNGAGCSISDNVAHDYKVGILGEGGQNRVQSNTLGLMNSPSSVPVSWVTKQYKAVGGEVDGYVPAGRNLGGSDHPQGLTLVQGNLSVHGSPVVRAMAGAKVHLSNNLESGGVLWGLEQR